MRGWSVTAAPTSPTRRAVGGHELQDPLGRDGAHPAVGGPAHHAVVAAPAAAPLRLDEEHRRQLGVGGEDLRAGRQPARRRPGRRGATRRPARAPGTRACGPAGPGARPGPVLRPGRPAGRGSAPSASPWTSTSTKGSSGSGLEKVSGPPATTSGQAVPRSEARSGSPARSSIVQHPRQLELVGHREGQDGELAQRRGRLEAEQRACGSPGRRPRRRGGRPARRWPRGARAPPGRWSGSPASSCPRGTGWGSRGRPGGEPPCGACPARRRAGAGAARGGVGRRPRPEG